jgi:three-Cys-motif partner protein
MPSTRKDNLTGPTRSMGFAFFTRSENFGLSVVSARGGMRYLRMTDPNDNQHRFGGPWTEIKLGVLERYLSAYATALKKQNFKLLYIDAFAGSGVYMPAGVQDAKAGSATIALQTDGLHRYCCIEKHQSHFSQLRKLRERFPTKSVELLQGDANEILPPLLAQLDARQWRGVLFLDPYGMGFAWETLKVITATGLLDVWYLFPLSGVFRQAARSLDAVDERKAAALDRCLGTPEWRDAFYREERQLDLFGNAPGMERFADVDAIERFVSNRLQEVFPAVAKPLRLPRTGAPFYSLFFAVSNPSPKAQELALKFAKALCAVSKLLKEKPTPGRGIFVYPGSGPGIDDRSVAYVGGVARWLKSHPGAAGRAKRRSPRDHIVVETILCRRTPWRPLNRACLTGGMWKRAATWIASIWRVIISRMRGCCNTWGSCAGRAATTIRWRRCGTR